MEISFRYSFMTLVVQGVSKSYGNQVVLDDLNFTISENGIVGLIGKNGVGKTTLLKILSGVSTSFDGVVTMRDIATTQLDRYKNDVGYMSEKNPLYEKLYVSEYLTWLSKIHGIEVPKSRVDQILKETDLYEVKSKLISHLSKGYKQRVGIAAALLHDPSLLILDEPVNGLDPQQIIAYRKMIRELSKDKIIILSSHLMQEIEAICDRVILLENGKISKDELLNSNSHEYDMNKWVVSLDQPIDMSMLNDLSTVHEVEQISESIYLITGRQNGDTLKELNKRVYESGAYIMGLTTYKEDLDQYFNN